MILYSYKEGEEEGVGVIHKQGQRIIAQQTQAVLKGDCEICVLFRSFNKFDLLIWLFRFAAHLISGVLEYKTLLDG